MRKREKMNFPMTFSVCRILFIPVKKHSHLLSPQEDVEKTKHQFKTILIGAGRMDQQLREMAILLENRILFPESRLKTVSNFSTRLFDATFWLLGTRHTQSTKNTFRLFM